MTSDDDITSDDDTWRVYNQFKKEFEEQIFIRNINGREALTPDKKAYCNYTHFQAQFCFTLINI